MRGIGTYPTYDCKLRIKSQVKRGETYMFNQLRYDHPSDIVPKMRFELQAPFAIKQEVASKTSPVLSEPLVKLSKNEAVRFRTEQNEYIQGLRP